MSSFQLKPQCSGFRSSNAGTGQQLTIPVLATYIEQMSDEELYSLIQLGMQASLKGSYTSNSSYGNTTTGGGW